MQGRVSPAWETISATRHIFLMLANPLHSLTFTEVGSRTHAAPIKPAGSLLHSRAPRLPHAGQTFALPHVHRAVMLVLK